MSATLRDGEMIRFVDFGKQLATDQPYHNREFGFYDTVTSRFVEDASGGQAWDCWQDFVESSAPAYKKRHMKRLRALLPDWALIRPIEDDSI